MRLLLLTILLLAPFASGEEISYWVEPCTAAESQCQPGDPELADWALQAWQKASDGNLHFERVAARFQAQIRIRWASAQGGLYGETQRILVNGKPGAEVYVLPAPLNTGDDRLLRDAIVYLTCLHESGHALGLAHTADFADIMFSFQYGGDIPEYFGRYRRQLQARSDIRNHSGLSDADRKHLASALAAKH